MKKMNCLAVSMLVLAGLAAPAAEQSPPAVVSVPSEMKRVVLVRLKYNTDLLEGLRQAVKDEKITNAVILSGVGSVTRFHVHAVSNTTLPAKLAYSEHAGPMDLIAVNARARPPNPRAYHDDRRPEGLRRTPSRRNHRLHLRGHYAVRAR